MEVTAPVPIQQLHHAQVETTHAAAEVVGDPAYLEPHQLHKTTFNLLPQVVLHPILKLRPVMAA
jgi:hypothetical protein